MINLLRKLFLVKEIVSKKGEVHFQRWRIINCKWFAVYIHRIFKEDLDKHLHNHPWNYFNLILDGWYVEESLQNGKIKITNMLPLSYSFRNHSTYHKIKELHQNTTTLFITGGRDYNWGYNVDDAYIENQEYRKNKHLGLYN